LSSQQDIESILSDMRQAIDCGHCYLVPRKENMDTLAQLGITGKDAFQEIMQLSVHDYFQGPMTDWGRPTEDDLWVFKKTIQDEAIYIKFKIEYQKNGEAKFVSFHIDRH
jgi:hypothetical protein